MPEETTTTISQPGSAAAPANSGQAAASGAAQQSQQATAQAKSPVIKPEDILAAMKPQRSPEEELELVKAQYGASSTEAKRLHSQLKELQSALSDQGIEPVFGKDGRLQGYKATDKYNKDAAPISLDPDELLSDKEKELLAEDPKKVLKSVIARVHDRAQKNYLRVLPTVEKVVEPLSAERLAAAHTYLSSRKDALDGSPLYPDYQNDKELVTQAISDLPKTIQDAFVGNETLLAQMVYSQVQLARQRLSAFATKRAAAEAAKQAGAQKEASVMPGGHGRAVVVEGDPKGSFLATLRQSQPGRTG